MPKDNDQNTKIKLPTENGAMIIQPSVGTVYKSINERYIFNGEVWVEDYAKKYKIGNEYKTHLASVNYFAEKATNNKDLESFNMALTHLMKAIYFVFGKEQIISMSKKIEPAVEEFHNEMKKQNREVVKTD